MRKRLTAGIVSGALAAIFIGLPAGVEAIMYRNVISGVKTLGLLMVTAMALASPLDGQRSGPEIWGANCGRCHLIQPANRYDAKGWEDIGLHMAITARLTSAEATAVTDPAFAASRTFEQLVAVITDGKDAMPPFAGAISLEEIRALAGYLLELGEVNR